MPPITSLGYGAMCAIPGAPPISVNQMLPSGPGVTSTGCAAADTKNSVMTPRGVMRAIAGPNGSANQRFPSGPVMIVSGAAAGFGS